MYVCMYVLHLSIVVSVLHCCLAQYVTVRKTKTETTDVGKIAVPVAVSIFISFLIVVSFIPIYYCVRKQ